MSSLNAKYYFTAKSDELRQFIRARAGRLVYFACFLVLGLVMGVLSSLKPTDAQEALDSVNGGMYGMITQASYAGYIFPLLLFTALSMCVMCFVGRYAYSLVVTTGFTVVMGFFQGATTVLVVRSFGVLALPLAVVYALLSVATDIIYFALFAVLADIASEKRKYGCSTPFLAVMKTAVYALVPAVIAVIVKSLLTMLLSFFL